MSAKRIRTAQKLRGMEGAGLRTIALPLLEESLARSLQLAASMDARGYGMSKKRSRYRPQRWLMRDNFVVLTSLFLALVMVTR
jgi:energy-coupling factor transporter transmembrane protein EcfT